tara:strand:- start:1933 stop:2184 length:252 start_codon:yes stop_codon:yes gene_type:complete
VICVVSSTKLPFEFTLDQSPLAILEGLTSSFVEKYGEEVFAKATMIIIKEEHFFNVIKNIYGVTYVGQHNDLFDEALEKHLEV